MEPKNRKDSPSIPAAARKSEAYDPPAVEQVMNADDLAREIHYAGIEIPSRDSA